MNNLEKIVVLCVACIVIAVGGVLFLTGFSYSEFYKNTGVAYPDIFLWAWERPEDFTFLEGSNVGVAFYAGAAEIRGSGTLIRGRANPLFIPENISRVPVIRVDNLRNSPITRDEITAIEDFVITTCEEEGIIACQVDFEPKASERELYENFIARVKSRLSASVPLQVTTLVSWCSKQSWLNDLNVDEVIPMFYRLGDEEDEIREGLINESFMKAIACQNAIGVTTDEPLPDAHYLQEKRLYIFNPVPWNKEELEGIMEKINSVL